MIIRALSHALFGFLNLFTVFIVTVYITGYCLQQSGWQLRVEASSLINGKPQATNAVMPPAPFDVTSADADGCDNALREASLRMVRLQGGDEGESITASAVMLDSSYLLTAAHAVPKLSPKKMEASDPYGRWSTMARVVTTDEEGAQIPLPRARPQPGQQLQPATYVKPAGSITVSLFAIDRKHDLALLRLDADTPLLAGLKPVGVATTIGQNEPLLLASWRQLSTRLGQSTGQIGSQVVTVDLSIIPGDSGSGVFSCKSGLLAGDVIHTYGGSPPVEGLAPRYVMPVRGNGGIVSPERVTLFLQKHWPNYGK